MTTRGPRVAGARSKPSRYPVGPGQPADCTRALELWPLAGPARYVLGHKGYDTNASGEAVKQAGTEDVIPSKKNRPLCRLPDRARYRQQNWVERFFNRLKDLRRLATRYEKTAAGFLGSASCISWPPSAGATNWPYALGGP